jgi:hypothetical protein
MRRRGGSERETVAGRAGEPSDTRLLPKIKRETLRFRKLAIIPARCRLRQRRAVPQPATTGSAMGKQKWAATWLAFAGGGFGLHRFYLHGLGDWLGWLHVPLTVAGLIGVQRMRSLGQDDVLAWWLVPLLGLSLAMAMAGGIVYGLMADERFNARFNGGQPLARMGWPVVLGVVACLMVGGGVTMATLAFSLQKYFESQLHAAPPGG